MSGVTQGQRDEWAALAEAATPGPWFVENVGNHGDKSASIECARWRGYVNTIGLGEDFATARFIAAARTAVPALLAENAELRAALDRAREDRDIQWDGRKKHWAEVQRLRDDITALADRWDSWALPRVLDIRAEQRSVAKATVRYAADLRALLNPTERAET